MEPTQLWVKQYSENINDYSELYSWKYIRGEISDTKNIHQKMV